MNPTHRTRAVAYVRVSTEKQAEHGVSLDAQRAKLTAYAALYDLDVLEVIVDSGVSAKTLTRPGLDRARAMLRGGSADALLIVKLDRLTRSVRDLGALVDEHFAAGKSALMSVSEQIDTRSAAGRLVLNVLASVAQWEREAVGERTSAAMRHKAAEGEFIGGGMPYGRRLASDHVHLEDSPEEQATIAAAVRLRLSGLTVRGVVAALAAEGHRGRGGRPFGKSQVLRLLALGKGAGGHDGRREDSARSQAA